MEWLDLGYGALFLATFLAATVIPLSSEALLAGMLASGFDPLLCLVIATSGNTLGGMSSYYLGWLADYHKLERWLGIKEQRVLRWKRYSDRYGPYLALISWAPFFGDVIAVALGVFKVYWPAVFWWMLLGKFLRFLIAILLMGYLMNP